MMRLFRLPFGLLLILIALSRLRGRTDWTAERHPGPDVQDAHREQHGIQGGRDDSHALHLLRRRYLARAGLERRA